MTSEFLYTNVKNFIVLKDISTSIKSPEVFDAANYAQNEILFETESLNETFEFTSNGEVYIASMIGFEWLNKIKRIKGGRFPKGKIMTLDINGIDELKARAGSTVYGVPKYVYHLNTNPLSFGLYPFPSGYTIQLDCVRVHNFDTITDVIDSDNISDTVNPIIPKGQEELMTLGTVVKLLQYRSDYTDVKGNYAIALANLLNLYETKKHQYKVQLAIRGGLGGYARGVKM